MTPIKGLVRGITGGQLVVKLETGDVVRTPIRDGINRGDKVLVGFDFENMKHGHILPDQHAALRENHELPADVEQVEEDLSERMDESQFHRVSLTGFEDDEGLEDFEVDDFEVLRFLSQGSEDMESSNEQ